MRGSPRCTRPLYRWRGIIPAHAGLTCLSWEILWTIRDHPRACGAHNVWMAIHTLTVGSSPRMRGSLYPMSGRFGFAGIIPAHAGLTRRPRYSAWLRGIIPAHAGLTQSALLRRLRPRDHPRACGAHNGLFFKLITHLGSSPRMRGSH